MKIDLGKLLKGAIKIAAPLIIGIATQKAQREVERQAEKLTRRTDKL